MLLDILDLIVVVHSTIHLVCILDILEKIVLMHFDTRFRLSSDWFRIIYVHCSFK